MKTEEAVRVGLAFGRAVKIKRVEIGLTQEDFAEKNRSCQILRLRYRTGCSEGFDRDGLETGRWIRLPSIAAMASGRTALYIKPQCHRR